MTRASVVASIQRNWPVVLLIGSILGAFGVRWVSPDQRVSALEVSDKAQDARLARVETAITILALKACGDTTVSNYEALTLQCAELRRR